MLRLAAIPLSLFFLVCFAVAQEQPAPAEPGAPPAARDRALISPQARLLAAKSAYISNVVGNAIPFNVISGSFDGWGRYNMVDSAEKADILVEVSAPEEEKKADEDGKTSVGGGSGGRGSRQASAGASKTYSDGRIRMTVRDAHTKAVLWTGAAFPKDSISDRKRNDHMVEVAQHLFEQFHDRVDPPQPAKQ